MAKIWLIKFCQNIFQLPKRMGKKIINEIKQQKNYKLKKINLKLSNGNDSILFLWNKNHWEIYNVAHKINAFIYFSIFFLLSSYYFVFFLHIQSQSQQIMRKKCSFFQPSYYYIFFLSTKVFFFTIRI